MHDLLNKEAVKRVSQKLKDYDKNLEIIEGSVEDLVTINRRVTGVELSSGEKIKCGTVVLTTGTFLRGVIRIGNKSAEAGRVGDKPSVALAIKIEKLNQGTNHSLDYRFSNLRRIRKDIIHRRRRQPQPQMPRPRTATNHSPRTQRTEQNKSRN